MKNYFLFACFNILCFPLFGQSDINYCEHQIDNSYWNEVTKLMASQNEECKLGMTSIPIALTFLMRSDSTSEYYEGLEMKILDSLMAHFIPSGIHPYLVAPPAFIYEDLVYDFVVGENVKLIYPGLSSDRLDIVIAHSVSNGPGIDVCGIANVYPNTVLVRYSCIESNSISHEMGHEFNLTHTHETKFGIELVNGSNCDIAGDLICDTPADPNRRDLCNHDCSWRGTYKDKNGVDVVLVDTNGDPYETDVSNMMSYYGVFGCRTNFTYQQSLVMHNNIDQKIGIYGYETAKMQFEIYDRTDICDVGYSVSTKVLYVDPNVTYNWDMDSDGNIDHSGTDITHLYTEYGCYTIKLIMVYPDGRSFYQSKTCVINYSNEFIKAPFLDDFDTIQERKYVKLIEQSQFKWNLNLHLTNNRIVASDLININENSVLEYNVNLGDLEHPVLEFEYNCNADAQKGGDSLLIELLNCDRVPVKLFEKWGKDLGTEEGIFQKVSIPIPNIEADVVKIRLTTKGDEKNWHYIHIDNFQIIEGVNLSTSHEIKEPIKVFPNPTSHMLHIHSRLKISKIELMNIYGQRVSSYYKEGIIELSNVATGVYFLKIQSGEQWYLEKVIKN